MRRLAKGLLVFALLVLAACHVADRSPAATRPPGPTYGTETIRAMTVYGVHLGMDAEAACQTLRRQGFWRGDFAPMGNDCTQFPPLDEGDTFFGDGGKLAGKAEVVTPFGTVFYVGMEYRLEGNRPVVSSISMSTHEPNQEAALEAATRAQWGDPTYYASWGYRVLNFASSPAQADFYNRAEFDRCESPHCAGYQEVRKCVAVRRRYAAAWLSVVIYDWGRNLTLEDNSAARDSLRLDRDWRDMRAGRQAYACAVPMVH